MRVEEVVGVGLKKEKKSAENKIQKEKKKRKGNGKRLKRRVEGIGQVLNPFQSTTSNWQLGTPKVGHK